MSKNVFAHLFLSVLLALILLGWMFWGVTARPVANLRVPGDYATIGEAIAAASEGDTIQVAHGTYTEHLEIHKAITLSGGWDESFSNVVGLSVLSSEAGLGRLITITAASSSTLVTIDHFGFFGGDATQQSEGSPAGLPKDLARSPAARAAAFPGFVKAADGAWSPVEVSGDLPAWRTYLQGLAKQGLYPGGEAALETALKQADRVETSADQQAVATSPRQTLQDIPPKGYGGGIYVNNASLRLLNSRFTSNIASTNSVGYGGGVAAVNCKLLHIRNTTFTKNQASSLYLGWGGAVYVDKVAAGGFIFEGNTVSMNQAGVSPTPGDAEPSGGGGGLYVLGSPGALISATLFENNVANINGGYAEGGGADIDQSDGVRLEKNRFIANTALASQLPNGVKPYGYGGGAMLSNGQHFWIRDNLFEGNVAATHMLGIGGGLAVVQSKFITITGNTLRNNWASYRHNSGTGQVAMGGGLLLFLDKQGIVISNTCLNNYAAFFQPSPTMRASGGGMTALQVEQFDFSQNYFGGNVASGSAVGEGGGLEDAHGSDTNLEANRFEQNMASLANTASKGGGLIVSSPHTRLEHNYFQVNRASLGGAGRGGGLAVNPFFIDGIMEDFQLDANQFFSNTAGGDSSLGGGVYVVSTTQAALTNNLMVSNQADQAGGVAFWGGNGFTGDNGRMVNNTLVKNVPSGLDLSGWYTEPLRLLNTIVVSHEVGIMVRTGISPNVQAKVVVDYILLNGNEDDIQSQEEIQPDHALFKPPQFVDVKAGNYHLKLISPARDAGDPAGVPPAPDHDLDGNARPFGPRVDLGAYELQQTVTRQYLPMMITRQPCNGYPCLGSFQQLAAWKPEWANPTAVSQVPLAERPASSGAKMLVGFDSTGWEYDSQADGATQGGSRSNLYAFNHWQYVDTAYYYRHGLIFIPPVVWTNAAHRNGVRMLGSVTADITNGGKLFNELFSSQNVQRTVEQLTALARTYRFDGWMIDIENGATPTQTVAQAIADLRKNGLYALYYEAGIMSLRPDYKETMALVNASDGWQSDYGISSDDPPRTYETLSAQSGGPSPRDAYSAAYLFGYSHPRPCAPGELDNGLECNRIADFLSSLSNAISDTQTGGYWTSLGVYAPSWPAHGGTSGWATIPAPEVWQPLDDRIWEGTPPSGPDCSTRNSGGLSQWVTARGLPTNLPFVTRFNRGFGAQYTVAGEVTIAKGWNHIGAQDILPSWLCQTGGLNGTLKASLQDGVAWQGGTALRLSGSIPANSSVEYALWNATIPISDTLTAWIRYRTPEALPVYLRLDYDDATSQVISGTSSGAGWQIASQELADSAGKTIRRVSIGVQNPDAAAHYTSALIGEIGLARPGDLALLPMVDRTPHEGWIEWETQAEMWYANIWGVDENLGCAAYLGPAFSHTYQVDQPMLALPDGVSAGYYRVQPVNASGRAEPLGLPVCNQYR